MNLSRDKRRRSALGRKSRFGCRNCKLRKLKCDEAKPQCLRCRNYGVRCNYGSNINVADLQPVSERTSRTSFPVKSPRAALSNGIWAQDEIALFVLDAQDQDLFRRFQYHTLYSLGVSETVEIYETYMLNLCFTSPFLMHGILALAAVHDRYLGASRLGRRSIRESQHWSRCTSLFNIWLSQEIQEEHKDPLWATATMLAMVAFSSVNAPCPGETFPLCPPDVSDLEWLRLGEGKMSLWKLVNPLRPGSIFRGMSRTFASLHEPLPKRGVDGVVPELVELCELHDYSNRENNPYFSAAHSISRLLEATDPQTLQERSLMAMNNMDREFAALLDMRDDRALLLLAIWYAKARQAKWWIDFRAMYEIPAIRSYLAARGSDHAIVRELLPWAKGLATVSPPSLTQTGG